MHTRSIVSGTVLVVALGNAGALSMAAEVEAGPQASASASGGDLDGLTEVVVTAQRKAQTVLSVPASITATTGLQLEAVGITQISELQFNTPGFLPLNGVGYTQVYIRGIGNNLFVGADPSVVTNIDDVPRIYGSMVNNLVNVERVEVLKGAQGGLYGRNATGGVVNILTRQPSDVDEIDGKVSYGTKNTLEASVYGNLKINDNIAWNVAIQRDSHDAYVKNLLGDQRLTADMFPTGGGPVLGTLGVVTPAQTAAFFNSAINPSNGYGNQDFWAADTKLRVDFLPNLKLTLDADWSAKHDSEGNQWVLTTPGYSQATDQFILGSFGVNAALPPGFFKAAGNFEDYNTTPAAAWLTDYGTSAKVLWTVPGVEFTNILAYRAQQTFYSENYAHAVTVDVPIVDNSKWYVFEELRAAATDLGAFHVLGGATYLKDHLSGKTTNLLFPPISTVPIPAVSEAAATFTQSTDLVKNWSVYAQVGYDITSDLSLTASGRYIHESNLAIFTSPVNSQSSIDASKFLPSATLSYHLQGGGNIYARFAKGFKAGGVNPIVPPNFFPTDFGKVFGPEQVSTYEVGYKNGFFDQKVQATAAIFYNDLKGLQYETNGNVDHPALIEAIINAGTARTYGAEASLAWRVIRPLTLSANAAYLNAKYKSFSNTDGTVLNTFDYSGRGLVDAPKWQLGFTANLDQPLNDRFAVTGDWLTSYTSDVTSQFSTFPGLGDAVIREFWLTNLRIGVKTRDDRYRFSVYADNVFNRPYFTFNSVSSLGADATWGNPRIIGGEFAVKFQ
jgi:iron complex outermembrane recepter protein